MLRALLCISSALLLTACAASSTPQGAPPAALADFSRRAGTPLAIEVTSPGARGHGSGILVHPRIILTAGHIVPVDASSVTAFTSPGAAPEVVRILNVLPAPAPTADDHQPTRPLRDWAVPGHEDDDWALLILSAPFTTLDALPAAVLDDTRPALGDTVIVAGFPFADGGLDPARRADRRALLAASSIIPGPADSRSSDHRYFGRGVEHGAGHLGASGSPVFVDSPGDPPRLVGIYIGAIGYEFLGIRTSSEMMFRRLPIEVIRNAIDSLSQDSQRTTPPTAIHPVVRHSCNPDAALAAARSHSPAPNCAPGADTSPPHPRP